MSTTQARHFTEYSLRHSSSGDSATLDDDIPAKLNQMNPMYHLAAKNPGRSRNWWVRVGTSDTDTAMTVVGNLTLTLSGLGDSVNTLMYWDQGHSTDIDPDAFIAWIGKIAA